MSIIEEGWEGLDFTQNDNDVDSINMDMKYAKVFSTPEGKEVLENLKKMTIERPCWYPVLPANYGYVREGQNMIVRGINRRIERAITKQ